MGTTPWLSLPEMLRYWVEDWNERDHTEWWGGRLADGREGMFPSTYVEQIAETAPAPRNNPPTSPRGLPTPPQPKLQTVVALYDFVAENSSEVSLRAGDVITLTRAVAGEDWWSGQLADGSSGLFPSTYVQLK